MAETIKTITDKGQFEEIFQKFFSKRDVFIKTKSGDLFIQFLGYNDGNVAFRIPRVKSVPDTIMTFTRVGDNTIYASLKFLETNEDTFIFLPIKFQIISEKRREERTELGTPESATEGKNVIFLSNIISEPMIKNALDSNEKKVNSIKEKIAGDLKGKFDRLKIVFINETRIDARMKFFLDTWIPLFIPDIAVAKSDSSSKEARFYITDIYSKDYKLASQKEIVSEVAVPIIYKNMVPYGYIQVNNTKPMDTNHFTLMKRFAVMINEFFLKENLFVPAKEKFIVNDLSSKGLGIVFRDRRLIRFFLKDSHVIIDLTLPDTNKVTMRVIIRNTVFNESGIIKVGMEIVNIDAISEVNYEEFLETMKQ